MSSSIVASAAPSSLVLLVDDEADIRRLASLTGVKYETRAHRNYGMDDYLVKPIQFKRLREVLEKHLPRPA